MKNTLFLVSATLGSALVLTSCRGGKSSEPPVLLVQNMYDQTSYGPQSENTFFADKRAVRAPVTGTVAQGEDRTNTKLYQGLEADSTPEKPEWVQRFPFVLTSAILNKGHERYNIYCSSCHGYDGHNGGLVTKAAGGSIRPALLHDDDKVALPVGKIYDAVTNGVNNWNMPGFKEQMSVMERWSVVAYVRALQLSQRAQAKDVPKDILQKINLDAPQSPSQNTPQGNAP